MCPMLFISSYLLVCFSPAPTQKRKEHENPMQTPLFSSLWFCSYCSPLNSCIKILKAKIIHATLCAFFFAPFFCFFRPGLSGFLFRLPAAALFRAYFPMAHRCLRSSKNMMECQWMYGEKVAKWLPFPEYEILLKSSPDMKKTQHYE